MIICGRKKEIKFLNQIYESTQSEFIAIYGRRRIGKTYLISNFFKQKGVYFELTGRKNARQSVQLSNFATVYADTFNQGQREEVPKDWDSAFNQLRYKIESIPTEEKIVLFLDELPWLATPRSGFLEALDLFWNRYLSRYNNIILIICGSAASWMIKKVIHNKAGLHNRLTRPPINLMPFTLKETEHYLESKNIQLERKQIIDLYMALGGVPYYLNLVPQGKSSSEIISELFFSSHAPLLSEFYKLYESLFDHAQKHIEILKTLAKTKQGLPQKELIRQIDDLSPGGGAVTIFKELESCGFILKIPQYGKKKKDALYRLIDCFSLFYLQWVQDIGEVSESYWLRKKNSQQYNSWAGYAFENVCFQHYKSILKALELSVVAESKSGWKFTPLKNREETGVQIDLLIDRADKRLNICEIKFYNDEFVIDKSYAKNLKRKKSCFQEQTKTKKTIFLTMLTTYGVKKNSLYFDCVDNQLTMDALFTE